MSFRSVFVSITTVYVLPLSWRMKEMDAALCTSLDFDDSYASDGNRYIAPSTLGCSLDSVSIMLWRR